MRRGALFGPRERPLPAAGVYRPCMHWLAVSSRHGVRTMRPFAETEGGARYFFYLGLMSRLRGGTRDTAWKKLSGAWCKEEQAESWRTPRPPKSLVLRA